MFRYCCRTMGLVVSALTSVACRRSRGLGVVGVLLYAGVIHAVYVTQISTRFAYLGYSYRSPELFSYLFSIVLACGVAALLPVAIRRVSDFVVWILFILAVLPSMLVVHYSGFTDSWQAFLATVALALAYGLAVLAVRRSVPPLPLRLEVPETIFWIGFVAFSLGTYGYLALTLGLRLQVVSIFDVYELRTLYKAGLATAPGLSYLVSIQANVLNTYLFARGVYSRRWLLIGSSVLGQALIYSAAGFKTVLFSIPAMLLVAGLFMLSRRPSGHVLLWGAVAASLAALLVDLLMRSYIATSLFTRRFLVTSGMLMSAYVAFFSANPPAMLGHSVLAGVVDYPYPTTPAHVVGAWVTGSETASLNAHFLADGFANFRWAGLFGAAAVLVIYLRVLDRVTAGVPVAATALVLLMPAITLSNTSILTAMLSHGLVACVVVFVFAPRTGWGRRPHGPRSTTVSAPVLP